MRKFSVASSTVVLSLVLSGGIPVHKSDAFFSDTTSAQGPQAVHTRCTHILYPKHVTRKEQIAAMRPGARCRRLFTPSKSGVLPNTPPRALLKASPEKIMLSCKSGETPTTCMADAKLKLVTFACDPDGDTMLYTFSVSGGKVLRGEELHPDEVDWDLTGVEPGVYTATLEADDGCGCLGIADATVSVVACPDCKPQ